MYALSKCHPHAFDGTEGFLYMAEQYSGFGEDNFHRAQLAQDPGPLIYTNSILSAEYGGENLLEAVFPVWDRYSVMLNVSTTHPRIT